MQPLIFVWHEQAGSTDDLPRDFPLLVFINHDGFVRIERQRITNCDLKVLDWVKPNGRWAATVFAMAILVGDPQILIGVSSVLLKLFGRLASFKQHPRPIDVVHTAGSIPNRNALSLSDYFKHTEIPFEFSGLVEFIWL